MNNFNLIDEPWIPVANYGFASLRDIFSNPDLKSLGGTPVEKIAITKLLLAICQSAITPQDADEWQALGVDGLSKACLTYLDKWQEAFYLFGDKPFLQLPAVNTAKIKSFGLVITDVSTGNTTCLTQNNAEKPLDNAQKALLLLTQMSLALGGKKTDNEVVLTAGYKGKTNAKGKPATSKPGPGIAHMGLLHSFAQGGNLLETLWFNLFTHQEINEIALYTEGLGIAPWEVMPLGEDCDRARELKNSLMGRLIPLCRFCLLTDSGLHFTEGLFHLSHKEGLYDPSITTKLVGKETKVVWTSPEQRPWRQLPSMLSFLSTEQGKGHCLQLKYSLKKARKNADVFGVWSGGMRVSSNAGEQYASGKDDTVESLLLLHKENINKIWFEIFTQAIAELDGLAKRLYGCVFHYFKEFKKDGADQAGHATLLFWQQCETQAQALLNECDDPERMMQLKRHFADYVHQTYNQYCPNSTSKQLEFWAKCRPNLSDYLK